MVRLFLERSSLSCECSVWLISYYVLLLFNNCVKMFDLTIYISMSVCMCIIKNRPLFVRFSLYICLLIRHLQSGACKAFQHVKVDTLCQPEVMSTVAVPGEAAWELTRHWCYLQCCIFMLPRWLSGEQMVWEVIFKYEDRWGVYKGPE